MIHKPIYVPTGRAKEYGDYAINIYTGCNHGCTYCFAPAVLRRDRVEFHSCVEPRRDIVESVKRQLDREGITGKLIHLCFTCDPYPAEIDTTPTRQIIRAIKESGNNVQILTKGGYRARRDFDLLDANDWFGVTHTELPHVGPNSMEPGAAPELERLVSLKMAWRSGLKTWVSCEPVIDPQAVYHLIETAYYIDEFKIGKMNHQPSDIDWAAFGRECERLANLHKRKCYIKDDLRAEMEAHP